MAALSRLPDLAEDHNLQRYFVLMAGALALAGTPVVAWAQPTPRPAPRPAASAAPLGPQVPLMAPVPVPTLPPSVAGTRAVEGVPQNITLQQAVDIAAAKSPVLAAARADYTLTQLPVDLARTGLFPNLSATGTTTHTNQSGRSVVSLITSGFSGTTNNLTATLRQLIYDGGRVIAEIHFAKAGAVAGLGTYQRNLETLAFNVAQSYYTALSAQASLNLAAQVLHQDEVQLALVEAQYRTGVASRVDVATAEVPVAQARVSLVSAEGTAVSSLAAFANQLGLDPDVAVTPINNNPSNPTQSLVTALPYNQSVTRALALRPDYLAAEYTVLSNKYNIQAIKAQLLPSLTGSASYGTSSTTTTGTNFAPNSSIGLALSIPIYDQGITRVETQQAVADLDLAKAQLEQTRLGVELSVRQALVGLVSAENQVAQTVVELDQAQTVLSATQAQYRAGVTTLPLLLNAEVSLISAQTSEVSAIYNLRQSEQIYIYALGQSSINPTSAPQGGR
jgi:outer membrane protein